MLEELTAAGSEEADRPVRLSTLLGPAIAWTMASGRPGLGRETDENPHIIFGPYKYNVIENQAEDQRR